MSGFRDSVGSCLRQQTEILGSDPEHNAGMFQILADAAAVSKHRGTILVSRPMSPGSVLSSPQNVYHMSSDSAGFKGDDDQNSGYRLDNVM